MIDLYSGGGGQEDMVWTDLVAVGPCEAMGGSIDGAKGVALVFGRDSRTTIVIPRDQAIEFSKAVIEMLAKREI